MKKLLLTVISISIFVTLAACDSGDDGSSSGDSGSVSPPSSKTPTTVTLGAFSDFDCTSNWTDRDGALGLKAGSGSGTCKATFPGVSGTYKIQLKIQTERDGAPSYSVSLNDTVLRDGNYPYACGKLMCNTPYEKCRDRNKDINLGTYAVKNGDTVSFYGKETYPCGSEHGAYAKWHSITFTPAN